MRRLSALPAALSALPAVWEGAALPGEERCLATGHAVLDAQLPGGGWPVGSLVEVLQAEPGRHDWQLLLPSLATAAAAQAGPVVLVEPPHPPFGPALAAQGLPAERLLCVHGPKPAARLWAAEQALRCADVAAVLAWLPQVKNAELRRLHLAASQHHKLLFVFRGLHARNESSPARVRLLLEGTDDLQVRILKRRGPPLETPLQLPAQPARLQALLASRRGNAVPAALPATPTRSRSHVLDRTEALAG
jgi:protein ImuA